MGSGKGPCGSSSGLEGVPEGLGVDLRGVTGEFWGPLEGAGGRIWPSMDPNIAPKRLRFATRRCFTKRSKRLLLKIVGARKSTTNHWLKKNDFRTFLWLMFIQNSIERAIVPTQGLAR